MLIKHYSLQLSTLDIAAAMAEVICTSIVDLSAHITHEQHEMKMHSLHPMHNIKKFEPELYKYWNARHQGVPSCTDQRSPLSFARVLVAHQHGAPDSSVLHTRPRRLQRRKK